MHISAHNCTATLQHLVAAALAPGRGLTANQLVRDMQAGDHLRNGPAALDSLDQLTAARAVAEFFELEKTGADELLLRRNQLGQWGELITGFLDDGTLTRICFRSGGTTGEPKLIPQPLAHLHSEVAEISKLVPDTRRIVALVPLHHIYGFIWGPLLSDQLGVPLIHAEDAIRIAHHELQAGDLLLGIPEWWQYLASSARPLPGGVTGITSTAPCPPGVINAVLDNGLSSMMEIYGSSDTGGIGWRVNRDTSFQLFHHWHRHDNEHLISDTGSVCLLPDLVHWESDQRLVPAGRRDNAIQVGGVNVWPERVGAFIATHPRVLHCSVRPLETSGRTRLKAFIVATGSADEAFLTELRDWLQSNLPTAERPVQLTVGDKLPRNELGKLCDW